LLPAGARLPLLEQPLQEQPQPKETQQPGSEQESEERRLEERQIQPVASLPPDPQAASLRSLEPAVEQHAQYSEPDVAAAQSGEAPVQQQPGSQPGRQGGPQRASAGELPAALPEV
jgi:hypothetical protein